MDVVDGMAQGAPSKHTGGLAAVNANMDDFQIMLAKMKARLSQSENKSQTYCPRVPKPNMITVFQASKASCRHPIDESGSAASKADPFRTSYLYLISRSLLACV